MKEISFTILFFLLTRELRSQDSTKHKHKKINLAGIPILSYNGSYGFIFGLNAMAFFHLDKRDTISPPSQAGLGGGYTENKSWFASFFAQLYFKEDKWRTTSAIGFGEVNFQYFEAVNEFNEGSFVDYNSVNRFFFLRILRKIKGPLYGGVVMKFQHSKTKFHIAPDSTQELNANGIGGSLVFDTRDYIYHPSRGWFISATCVANPEWLGSDSSFSSLRFFTNYYFPVNRSSVLATRFSIFTGLGHVPFSAQHAVGGRDIRGYTDGRYRGNQVYCLQTEYRWNFCKRWGMVGFTGVAFTGNPSSPALPSVGAGIRFMAIRTHKINIGIDAAIGKDDQGIYFRINEAF